MTTAPALPWGAAAQQTNDIEIDLPAKLGLGIGERVQVKWYLDGSDEDAENNQNNNSECVEKWWGATISQKQPGATDGEGRIVYEIVYDADPALGFTETDTHRVTFLEEHELYDLEEDERLPWRVEGSDWDDDTSPEGKSYSLEEVARDIRKGERLRGKTIDDECAEMLSALPVNQQHIVAAAFRDFTEGIGSAVAELCKHNGPGYTVQKEDVEEILAKIRMNKNSD